MKPDLGAIVLREGLVELLAFPSAHTDRRARRSESASTPGAVRAASPPATGAHVLSRIPNRRQVLLVVSREAPVLIEEHPSHVHIGGACNPRNGGPFPPSPCGRKRPSLSFIVGKPRSKSRRATGGEDLRQRSGRASPAGSTILNHCCVRRPSCQTFRSSRPTGPKARRIGGACRCVRVDVRCDRELAVDPAARLEERVNALGSDCQGWSVPDRVDVTAALLGRREALTSQACDSRSCRRPVRPGRSIRAPPLPCDRRVRDREATG